MTVTIADQYLAQNAGRRFPLADDTTGLSDTSLLDARITTSGLSGAAQITPVLTKVDETDRSGKPVKVITISLFVESALHDTISFDIPYDIASSDAYTAFAESEKSYGELVVTASVLAEDNGEYSIPMSVSEVVCRPTGVDSLQGVGAKDLPSSEKLTGDIVLDPGRNADPYIDGQNIRLDIYKGAGIGEFCQDATTGQTCDRVMFTINGVKPGSDGELVISGKGGIRVTPFPDENAIEIAIDSVSIDRMTTECETRCR